MEKFTIMIRDNESGEIEVNTETDGILAIIDLEDRVQGISYISCSANSLCNMIEYLDRIKNNILSKHPEVALALAMHNLVKELDDSDD